MIGGTDIVIATQGGAAALDACVRVVSREWPDAVFEDARSPATYYKPADLPLGATEELFVYKDADVARSWEEKGADKSLQNTMIHLLLTPREVTLVVDDANDPAMKSLLASIRSALTDPVNGNTSDGPARLPQQRQ